MIGGYVYRQKNEEIIGKLNFSLGNLYTRVSCATYGFLFYDEPYPEFKTTACQKEDLTFLSQDLLVGRAHDNHYYEMNGTVDLPELFSKKKAGIFEDIVSEYRLIVFSDSKADPNLYLVSNRAGNGRIYYSQIDSGIIFSSDIRFLLRIIPLQMNDLGLYAILKYGAIPEPLTISENISAVPAAHYLSFNIENGKHQISPYFQFQFPCDQNPVTDDFDQLIRPSKEILLKSAQFLGKYNPAILISGGIDSSLYAACLHEVTDKPIHGINCIFGDNDPEASYARAIADQFNLIFHTGRMDKQDALNILDDTIALTGHPFSDFSSFPIVFILKFMKDNIKEASMLIEGNGGDDCFGFSDLATQSKMVFKSRFPRRVKSMIARLFKNSETWKIETDSRFLARLLALSDVHEMNTANYFLALTPANFLGLSGHSSWDQKLNEIMEKVFTNLAGDRNQLSYQAKMTIRQLMHVNSRRWAAKAYSVGENLGIRIIYPYIWRDILLEQGNIPWPAKINKGVVKWPLKRLLEDYMPKDFIYRKKSGFVPPFKEWLTSKNFNQMVRDSLLATDSNITRIVPQNIIEDLLNDALQGKNLRHAILNFLWGGLFTELWIKKQKS